MEASLQSEIKNIVGDFKTMDVITDLSPFSLLDDEDKRKIEDLVKKLKEVENKELITSESSYLTHLSTLTGPGLSGIDELDFEAYIATVGDGCYAPNSIETRRTGHQLPESPPDSGSENPYSPSESQMSAISVPPVLNAEYMQVHEHLPSHEILQNGDYIYEALKNDDVLRSNLNDVVVLPQDTNLVELGIRSVRHDLDLEGMYQNRYPPLGLEQGMISPQLVALSHEGLTPVYTSLQEPNPKRRKHEDTHNVKCEPAALSPECAPPRAAPPSAEGSEAGDEAPMQCIRFAAFQQTAWHALLDCNLKPLQPPSYVVGADKGFNYSQIDEAFVCQKKNHFQVTCQIQMQGDPHYVKTSEGFKKINNFCLHFYGVKAEDPTQEVRVEQSQSDRTKKPFHPVPVELRREGTKITVGRLHFAETTNNNMRKKGRPNPDQRHFQLVVALRAHTPHADYIIAAHASDRIIVRASNPGQFESDCPESWWQRGASENSVHFNGRVGINTDRPDEACVVNGNLKVMGQILHPSDARAKHNIEELDTAQQLKNVQSLRVVKFNYAPSFAEHSGLVGYEPLGPRPADTGVIAQEVRTVLPDAVREAGDVAFPNGDTITKFLVVNKERIFMENIGAVKELCKVTGLLESRIDQLERVNRKLCGRGLQRRDSTRSSGSNDSRYSAASNSSKSIYSDGNISIDQIRDIARNIRKHECCHKLSHHSPKYTRKQCKNCHTYSKYGKYYNYNKTCLRFDKEKNNGDNPTYVDTETPSAKTEETIKKKDTCLWVRSDEDFSYGNTNKLGFCCRRKDYSDASSELISNKFLQVVITILIFIMAVCLVVMSALYFREHQELITMKEIRMHEKFTNYPHYEKINGNGHKAPPDQNQIHNSKSAQHSTAKKTAKEKGHKTTLEYSTSTSSEPPHVTTNLLNLASNHFINTVQTSPPPIEQPMPITKTTDVIGNGCYFALNTNNELDPECQSSCGLDPPQTYENQESLDRKKSDQKDKQIITPVIPEKNNSKALQKDTEPLKMSEDLNGDSNFLESSKQNVSDNISRRVRRDVRYRRETDEMSSDEMGLDQSREIAGNDCEIVHFGVTVKPSVNMTLFSEKICVNTLHNFTYTVPLSQCLNHKNLDITFRTTKLKDFRLCDLRCTHDDPSKSCQRTETSKPIPSGDTYIFKMTLDCNIDRMMKIRAVFGKNHLSARDLCYNIPEPKIPFVEYNVHIHRYCQN